MEVFFLASAAGFWAMREGWDGGTSVGQGEEGDKGESSFTCTICM